MAALFSSNTQLWLAAKLALAVLLVSAGFSSAAPASKQTPPVAWVFQMHRDKSGTPSTDVFLRVGGKQTLVMRQAQEEFEALPRSSYKDHAVPAQALAACAGWFAGAGDDLYVIRRGRSLVVYRKQQDEQAPDFPWKRLKVIALK